MARNFHRKQGVSAVTDLNVAPLMDLAFSLLIIFMVSTPLLEQSIELDLPTQPPAAVKAAETEIQVVNVDAKGQIYWGKQPVSFLELEVMLSNLSKTENPKISFRADKSLTWQQLVTVIDAIKRNNISTLHLDTRLQ